MNIAKLWVSVGGGDWLETNAPQWRRDAPGRGNLLLHRVCYQTEGKTLEIIKRRYYEYQKEIMKFRDAHLNFYSLLLNTKWLFIF